MTKLARQAALICDVAASGDLRSYAEIASDLGVDSQATVLASAAYMHVATATRWQLTMQHNDAEAAQAIRDGWRP